MKIKRASNTLTNRSYLKRSGVTVVETMVAVSLLAVFLAGVSKLLIIHRRTTDMARAHYTAVNLAKNRLEAIRNVITDTPTLLPEFVEDKLVVNQGGFSTHDGDYRRSTTITDVSATLGEVVVSVEIRDRRTLGFEGRVESLQTLFYKP